MFKTWSPEATAVKVKLYNTGSDNESGSGTAGTYAMRKNNTTGVWSCTIPGDLKNQYYTYLVTVNGITRETQDIYAKAAGVNGRRSMIVDLDATDPDGWENDRHVVFRNAGEAVVWEVHVRDFSAHENAGVTAVQKYLVELLTLDQAQLLLADVNHDGEVSIADATLIQMMIAN